MRVGHGTICTFTNRYTRAGEIRIHKVTLNGTGTTRFQIRPTFGQVKELEQLATTKQPGEAVAASGDDSDALLLGEYAIRETITSTTPGDNGQWQVDSVLCDGVPVPAVQGRILITLTSQNPTADCVFTNELIRKPDPPEPPPPDPPPVPPIPPPAPVPNPAPGGVLGETASSDPTADLVLTKRVRPRRVTIGKTVHYVITVRNRGPATARAVTIAEQRTPVRRKLNLRPSRGRCANKPTRHCVIGDLAPGARATVKVTVRTQRTGRFRNVVAVNTATRQTNARNLRAAAVLLVSTPRRPRFTG